MVINNYNFKKSEAVMMRGLDTEDSRKSLSPVKSTSTLALIAARRIGLSKTSRIAISDSYDSSGVGTIEIVVSAIAKKASSVASLFGNFH